MIPRLLPTVLFGLAVLCSCAGDDRTQRVLVTTTSVGSALAFHGFDA